MNPCKFVILLIGYGAPIMSSYRDVCLWENKYSISQLHLKALSLEQTTRCHKKWKLNCNIYKKDQQLEWWYMQLQDLQLNKKRWDSADPKKILKKKF